MEQLDVEDALGCESAFAPADSGNGGGRAWATGIPKVVPEHWDAPILVQHTAVSMYMQACVSPEPTTAQTACCTKHCDDSTAL